MTYVSDVSFRIAPSAYRVHKHVLWPDHQSQVGRYPILRVGQTSGKAPGRPLSLYICNSFSSHSHSRQGPPWTMYQSLCIAVLFIRYVGGKPHIGWLYVGPHLFVVTGDACSICLSPRSQWALCVAVKPRCCARDAGY